MDVKDAPANFWGSVLEEVPKIAGKLALKNIFTLG